jgi:hypothetical protein
MRGSKISRSGYTASFSNHSFLCFGGRFLLSSITRVFAGTIPDLRAARRASVPFSNFFLPGFLICRASYTVAFRAVHIEKLLPKNSTIPEQNRRAVGWIRINSRN